MLFGQQIARLRGALQQTLWTGFEDSLREQQSLRRWKIFWAVVVCSILTFAAIRITQTDVGDFRLHWEFGRRLWAGESIYGENGLDRPYLPFWAVAHAPLTVLPRRTAQILLLPLIVVSGWGLLRLLNRHTSAAWSVSPRQQMTIAVLACLVASRFLIRDVYECGVNLALVTLSWWAVSLWSRRREWAAGGTLGLAIALKSTPALFVVWFAWKRQWKVVATTSLVTVALMLSPVIFMGTPAFVAAHQEWAAHAANSLVKSDPTRGVLGEEPLQNMGLRPAIGRFLIKLPTEHDARIDHPGYIDFLDLPPAWAGIVVKACLLCLLLGVAWTVRGKVPDRKAPEILWQASAVSLLILLLSPLTWGQHCVGVLPALYLLFRSHVAAARLPRITPFVLSVFVVCVLVLNRTLLGKTGTYLLDSYYVTTWCLLALLLVVLAAAKRATFVLEPMTVDVQTSPGHQSTARPLISPTLAGTDGCTPTLAESHREPTSTFTKDAA